MSCALAKQNFLTTFIEISARDKVDKMPLQYQYTNALSATLNCAVAKLRPPLSAVIFHGCNINL